MKRPANLIKSDYLTGDAATALLAGFARLRELARKGNALVFVTARFSGIETIDPARRPKVWTSLRKKLHALARSRGFTAAYAWTRECDPGDPSSEHWHGLVAVPTAHVDDFCRIAASWDAIKGWKSPGIARPLDVRAEAAYDLDIRRSYGDRYAHSIFDYLLKQAEGRVADKLNIRPWPSGRLLGCRSGVTAAALDLPRRYPGQRPPDKLDGDHHAQVRLPRAPRRRRRPSLRTRSPEVAASSPLV